MRYQVSVKLRKDFIEVNGNTITIGVTAPPEHGRANEEVIRKIAEYFRIPRSSVRILAGRGVKKKIIEVIA
ncbi:MAG: DUF167 domain-containing protein [Candidatus Sungbacteria bacterium]|nr:DUF167 domain-containing protein [Candidatus Sungbacteria bacterium]